MQISSRDEDLLGNDIRPELWECSDAEEDEEANEDGDKDEYDDPPLDDGNDAPDAEDTGPAPKAVIPEREADSSPVSGEEAAASAVCSAGSSDIEGDLYEGCC